MRFLIYIFILFFISNSVLLAQSRKDLESKRNSINAQISKANEKLKRTRSAQKTTKQELKDLQAQIGSREELIQVLSDHVDTINTRIDRKITVVEELEKDLVILKANYKKIIRQLYRYRLQKDALSFILSSSSFNEAYQRWIYLQHLENFRAEQAKAIKKTQEDLARYINTLEAEKDQKSELLSQQLGEKEALTKKKMSKAAHVSQLKKQEGRLRSDIKRKRRYKQQLSKKIESIIKSEIAKAKRAARRREQQKKKQSSPSIAQNNKAQKSTSKTSTSQPRSNYSSSSSSSKSAFAIQKGKLMSPVYHGQIVGKFGKQQHPKFKDVYINNNGIDIKGQYNSVIRNVYTGVVVSIFAIPGMNNAIMVKHGDYFTTYSNIAQVYVKVGQRVKTGAQLGSTGRDTQNGGHVMHFELWHGKKKENPSRWIKM